MTVLRQRLKVMDDFAQNIDAVHGGGELKPRFTFSEGFLSSHDGSDKFNEPSSGKFFGEDGDKGWDSEEGKELVLGLGVGQDSAVTAAMIKNVPTTLEYADTMSLQHLHTLFHRRMALKKGSDVSSSGPAAGSPVYHMTSPTQPTTSSTGTTTTISYHNNTNLP